MIYTDWPPEDRIDWVRFTAQGTARRELLDQLLIVSRDNLEAVLKEFLDHH